MIEDAKDLGVSAPEAAGIPETTGHPWWLYWARSKRHGEALAKPELEARQQAFSRNRSGGMGR